MFRAHERALFNVVYRWVWNREDAAEIVQEAFVRLWRTRASVDGARARPLLYRIAMNLASTRRRKVRRWLRVLTRHPATPPVAPIDGVLEQEQQAQRVREALETLPDAQRQVIVLCEFAKLSYAEVADALEIPVGTVGSRRNAGLKQLRAKLTEENANVRP